MKILHLNVYTEEYMIAENQMFMNCLQVGGGDVCYASLDHQNRGQRRLKKKRVESSDFSTYSEVKTDQI